MVRLLFIVVYSGGRGNGVVVVCCGCWKKRLSLRDGVLIKQIKLLLLIVVCLLLVRTALTSSAEQNREEFRKLVEECHKADIEVILDAKFCPSL